MGMAMAEPEADPALLYSHHGYPYATYSGYYPYIYGQVGYNSYPYTFHYGKREAEAEPEAEADPALIYTTNTLPLTSAVHSPLVSSAVYQPIVYNSAVQTPLVYKTLPVAEKTEKVATPLIYTNPAGVLSSLVSPLISTGVHQPIVYNSPI